MKLTLALFATASVALQLGSPVVNSPSLVQRDVTSISSAIAAISSQVTDLQTAINGFTGQDNVMSLNTTANTLISTIESGTSVVQASDPLAQNDALSLAPQIQDLSTLVNSTVQTLITKKDAFVSADVGPTVLQSFRTILNATQEFSSALISKLPDSLQDIGRTYAQPIVDSLNAGISAYSDQTGSASTASSGATATSVSGSSTATESSASSTASSSSGSSSSSASAAATSASSTSSSAAAAAAATGFANYGAAALLAAVAVVAL